MHSNYIGYAKYSSGSWSAVTGFSVGTAGVGHALVVDSANRFTFIYRTATIVAAQTLNSSGSLSSQVTVTTNADVSTARESY